MRTESPRRTLAAVVAVSALVLTGCASAGSPTVTPPAATEPAAAQALLAEHGLDDLAPETLVERLDRTAVADRPEGLIVSVRPDTLVVSDGQGGPESTLALGNGEFYLSLAPYVDQTHDCWFHSLTTCLGELRNEPVEVRITDGASGEVLVEESTTTYDNGFVGFWLPRGIEATVEVAAGGRTGSAVVPTGDEDATCLTTLRLA